MLPPASALRPNSSLLVSLLFGPGLCFLRSAGNNFAGGNSSPSIASSFLKRIQFFNTSTERSKPFDLFRCLLSADGSLFPCQSTSSKYYCISCCCFCSSPCTTRINTWSLCSPFDVAHIIVTGGITTNVFALQLFWILGESNYTYESSLS